MKGYYHILKRKKVKGSECREKYDNRERGKARKKLVRTRRNPCTCSVHRSRTNMSIHLVLTIQRDAMRWQARMEVKKEKGRKEGRRKKEEG